MLQDSIIVGTFTVIGSIVGSIITYFGAIKKANRDRFIDASQKLRDAFQDELTALQTDHDGHAINILTEASKKHWAIISEFKWVLPKRKRASFKQAWQQYCDSEFLQYDTKTGDINQRDKNRRLAIRRIEAILEVSSKSV